MSGVESRLVVGEVSFFSDRRPVVLEISAFAYVEGSIFFSSRTLPIAELNFVSTRRALLKRPGPESFFFFSGEEFSSSQSRAGFELELFFAFAHPDDPF